MNSNKNRKTSKIPTTLSYMTLNDMDNKQNIEIMYDDFKRIAKSNDERFSNSIIFETEKTNDLETVYAVFVADTKS